VSTENPTASRRTWAWVVVACLVVVAVVVAVILATRPDDDAAAPAPTTSTATTTGAPSSAPPTATPTTTTTARTGCAPTDDTTPASAVVAEVVDVDGDGREDQGWITGGADRRFGITTASGATFSAAIDSASPEPASAVVQRVQRDELPIALVDVGREALLYSLSDCAVTPVQNAQGEPYTFDRGFGDAGTGVGCTSDGGVLRLAGLNAVSADDGATFDVTRTFVDLSSDGRTATNGEAEQVATGAAKDDPVVTTAQEVSCDDLVAGQDGPNEPES
jgi:hypothetical protein